MSPLKPVNKSSATRLNQLVFKLAPQIVICSILLILVATLFPFDFSFQDGSIAQIISKFKHTSTHLSDQIKNLFLFLPLGFGLMCLFHNRRLRTIAKPIIVLLISFSLSLFVEILQAFTPSREPTIADIYNNTLSGFIGIICFYLWKSQIISYTAKVIEKNKTTFSIKQLTAIFLAYIALIFLMPFALHNTTNLSNWNLDYPLLLGNETTGNRPWRGYISDVFIADRAISKEEVAKILDNKNSLNNLGNSLVAYYPLSLQDGYSDRTGNLPDLTSRRQYLNSLGSKGVLLNAYQWLEAEPVKFLNQRIREANQFTIGATIATSRINQKRPGRIISLSNGATERNFTLEQRDSKLVVRLRTPLGGENATYIMNYVFDVFTDNNPHKIIITYTGSVLQVYIDHLQSLHYFNYLEIIPKMDKFMYYGLVFIPLGIVLKIITTLSQDRFIFYPFLYIGILLPSLILEVILATDSGRSIQLENILIGILITAFTLVLLKIQIPKRLRRKFI
jgi:VanZ family protein